MNCERLLEFEARKVKVFNLLKDRFLSVAEIALEAGIERSKAQHIVTSLMANHHLHKSKRQASDRKTVICYKATNYEYVAKDAEQIKKYISNRVKKMSALAHSVDDDVTPNYIEKVNDTTTVYRLLSRKRTEVEQTKPKRKTAYRGIGSSFALFDGV